jgi:hypothetical protein
MLLSSAFGQWDNTAHELSPPFNMSDWVGAQGVSGVGGVTDIQQNPSGLFQCMIWLFLLKCSDHDNKDVGIGLIVQGFAVRSLIVLFIHHFYHSRSPSSSSHALVQCTVDS